MPRKKYTYLLLYNNVAGSYERFKRFLDSRMEIANWFRCMPHSFFIVSELTATQLTDIFRQFTKDKGNFLILDTATDRNGWMPKAAWEFMRNPKGIGDKDS